jgi:hypothetical protein
MGDIKIKADGTLDFSQRKPLTKEFKLDSEKVRGTLDLIIVCHQCKTMFEVNHEALAMAHLLNPSFNEFLEYVMHGKCKVCEGKEGVFDGS